MRLSGDAEQFAIEERFANHIAFGHATHSSFPNQVHRLDSVPVDIHDAWHSTARCCLGISRKRFAAAASRLDVSRKSMVWPVDPLLCL
jgi:hypothetical protein